MIEMLLFTWSKDQGIIDQGRMNIPVDHDIFLGSWLQEEPFPWKGCSKILKTKENIQGRQMCFGKETGCLTLHSMLLHDSNWHFCQLKTE